MVPLFGTVGIAVIGIEAGAVVVLADLGQAVPSSSTTTRFGAGRTGFGGGTGTGFGGGTAGTPPR